MVEMTIRRWKVETILQIVVMLSRHSTALASHCSPSLGGRSSHYLTGDMLRDSQDCIGPSGQPYPSKYIADMIRRQTGKTGRTGRTLGDMTSTMDPLETQRTLLAAHEMSVGSARLRREAAGPGEKQECTVGGSPPRLCKSTYNTTAPMYGVSLTSGQPVTIVQKFPDLLQQVIYETCDTSECDILHGECIQTYVPYLFLVIPLGPVTLTGQDYVLVESGCTCRPKYATPGTDPNPQDIIPNFN